MLTILRRTVGLWWQTWPWLVAIYLIGWFLRYWAVHLAMHVALSHGDFWGSLILPLAPLTRLLTFLAMFLVIRSATPGLPGIARFDQATTRHAALPLGPLRQGCTSTSVIGSNSRDRRTGAAAHCENLRIPAEQCCTSCSLRIRV